jgi:phosphate acetyltransferase
MSKAVYIATSEPNSGKSIVTLGLMKILLGRTPKVGYFRPIINDVKPGTKDNHVHTVISYFDLDINYNDAYGFTRSEFVKKLNQGKEGEIIDTLIEKYKVLENTYDFIIVEGTDFSGKGTAIELDSNILIAKNLGIPAIIVSSGIGRNMDEFIGDLHIAYDAFKEKEVEVISVVANKIKEENITLVKNEIKDNFPVEVIANVIPLIESLKNPTIKEIGNVLNANFLIGEAFNNNQVASVKVGAMQLRNYLTRLEENCLIITPGDRADIILGALQANISSNYPTIAGMILTGGLMPEESILKLIEGLPKIIPILYVEDGTFNVTKSIGAIESQIYADNKRKILSSIATFENNVNVLELAEKLIEFKSDRITPRMFQYQLQQKAKNQRKHIVLPEGNDQRVLRAAAQIIATNLVDLTLLGTENEINILAADLKLNLKGINIVDPIKSKDFEDYAQTFYALRKHKNVTLAMARDIMTDVSYFGTMMVHKNDADGMVSGAAHTTQHTIRPALQFIKTKPGVSVVSSVFFMCLEDRVSVFGDCAINPNPNAQQLAEIAFSSAKTSKAFGIQPKVAMLSYSSGSSGKGVDVDKVREATEIVRKRHPKLKIEGPIQYDAAVDQRIGKSKLPNSDVAGQASVFIFPDLNTGNNTYKAVQRETGALAIGPILQGLNKPVNDLSRGCTVGDIYNTVIITAIQAQDQ